ncbi:hypothetical protein WA026_012412, partial [Henosepilachna vigintioctopunctata]
MVSENRIQLITCESKELSRERTGKIHTKLIESSIMREQMEFMDEIIHLEPSDRYGKKQYNSSNTFAQIIHPLSSSYKENTLLSLNGSNELKQKIRTTQAASQSNRSWSEIVHHNKNNNQKLSPSRNVTVNVKNARKISDEANTISDNRELLKSFKKELQLCAM